LIASRHGLGCLLPVVPHSHPPAFAVSFLSSCALLISASPCLPPDATAHATAHAAHTHPLRLMSGDTSKRRQPTTRCAACGLVMAQTKRVKAASCAASRARRSKCRAKAAPAARHDPIRLRPRPRAGLHRAIATGVCSAANLATCTPTLYCHAIVAVAVSARLVPQLALARQALRSQHVDQRD